MDEQRKLPGKRGGFLLPKRKGDPAHPGAGRPRNPFKSLVQDFADGDVTIRVKGQLVEDGKITDKVVEVSVSVPGAVAVVMKAYKQAAKGDPYARKWITETGWDKTIKLGVDPESGSDGFAIILPSNQR